MDELTRRRALLGLGGTAVASVVGCLGGGGDGGTTDGETTDGETTDGATTDGETTTTAGEVSADIDAFLADANGYDGTVLDFSEAESIAAPISVGGEELAFDPPAVRIPSSATVNWFWNGGTHNVASTGASESDFRSGDPTGDTATTFSQSFDNTGTRLYVCEVHEGQGMKGAIEVVEG
ncbi:halocyanin domain-containing protein [Halobacteriales archaeon SW_7_68_16]|nr:MAG: halocyanin domain-containing protein [Halobacteriales archaeon SW_7_68_16]